VKVLVTGSSGFIGRHLTWLLADAGHDVHGLDKRAPAAADGWTHHECDLLDAPGLARALGAIAPDVFIHLAARADLDEKQDLEGYAANTVGVENLLAAVCGTPRVRRAIITSTQLVCRVGYMPRHETDYQPSTLYGESKVRTEHVWRDADGGGREWCIVRPTTIWGPHMMRHYLTFFSMVRDGRYFHVGDGGTLKSYGYVGNTVHQYMQLMLAPAADVHRRTLYLTDYEPIRVGDWAEAFRHELAAPRIRHIPRAVARTAARAGDVLNRIGFERMPFNTFRLNNVLTPSVVPVEATAAVCGPQPYTLEDGVRRTVEWLREIWEEERPRESA
jgi:GlcNAc-P-P-Und epimerase